MDWQPSCAPRVTGAAGFTATSIPDDSPAGKRSPGKVDAFADVAIPHTCYLSGRTPNRLRYN